MRGHGRSWVVVGWPTLPFVAAVLVAGCDSTTEPRRDLEEVRIEAVTPTELAATAGTELTAPPTVRATNGAGRPVAGIAVSFAVAGGGSIAHEAVETDGAGIASVGSWRLGHRLGAQRLTVSAAGMEDVVFTATALPVRLEATSPTVLIGVVGTELASPPTVRATDESGRPVSGARIFFARRTGFAGGSVERPIAFTDVEGYASAGRWTLGTLAIAQVLSASAAGGVSVDFTATALPGPIARVTVSSGRQVGRVGEKLPHPLVARVADAFENVISGVPITARVSSGGGSLEGTAAVTGEQGLASAGVWTLGPTVGVQQVTVEAAEFQVVFSAYACQTCPELLFVRNGQIHRGDGVGGPELQLTSGGSDGSPAWSPDGQRIAFMRVDGSGVPDIHVMRPDGSGVRRVTFGRVDSAGIRQGVFSPAWSPDGRILAVASGDQYAGGVYLVNLEEENSEPVLFARMAWDPAWSPDGQRIAFVSLSGEDDHQALHVMSADGSAVAELVSRGPYSVADPAWSPDGRHIAFSKCSTGGRVECDIHMVSADGSSTTRLTAGTDFVLRWGPAWSPDGGRVAFTAFDVGEYWIEFVLAEGGTETFLLDLVGDSPSWRP